MMPAKQGRRCACGWWGRGSVQRAWVCVSVRDGGVKRAGACGLGMAGTHVWMGVRVCECMGGGRVVWY